MLLGRHEGVSVSIWGTPLLVEAVWAREERAVRLVADRRADLDRQGNNGWTTP